MDKYDLNVRVNRDTELQSSLVQRSAELGWDCIAWNVTVVGSATSASMKSKLPEEIALNMIRTRETLSQRAMIISPKIGKKLGVGSSKPKPFPLRQLSRITVVVDEVVDAQSLSLGNELIRKFDVVAATPGNGKVFAHLCRTGEVDIISLDFSHKLPFSLNKKLIDEAILRGITFEIIYSPLLGSSNTRRETIAGTKTLIQYLSGRHIIITSGAETVGQLRGVLDVQNIATILGISKQNVSKCLGCNCARVIQHANARRMRYVPLEVMTKEQREKKFPELNYIDSRSAESREEEIESKERGKRKMIQEEDSSEEEDDESESEGDEGEGDGQENSDEEDKYRNQKKKKVEQVDGFLSF